MKTNLIRKNLKGRISINERECEQSFTKEEANDLAKELIKMVGSNENQKYRVTLKDGKITIIGL